MREGELLYAFPKRVGWVNVSLSVAETSILRPSV